MQIKKLLLIIFAAFSLSWLFAQANPVGSKNLSDGQIIKILKVINKGEIAASKIAVKKSNNASVQRFANTMIQAHGQNLKDTKNLARQINVSSKDSSVASSLKNNGKSEIKTLKAAATDQISTTYINAMVKDHQAALNLFNTTLIPNASNPQLVNFLKNTKMVVMKHLARAKALQKKNLMASSLNRGKPRTNAANLRTAPQQLIR